MPSPFRVRSWQYAIGGTVASLLTACTAPPGLGPGARRSGVDVTVAPWRSVGLTVSEVGTRCTATLVASRAVLTAAHCLYDPRNARPLDARQVRFVLAPTSHGNADQARGIQIVTMPGFSVGAGMQRDPAAASDADWAVLVLDTDLGGAARPLPLAEGYVRPGTPIAFGGYQADSGLQMLADTACSVTGYNRDSGGRIMMRHSCAATNGSSGGPLLAQVRPDQWVVVGIGSFAESGVSGGWAVPTAAIAQAARSASLISNRPVMPSP